MIKSPLPSFLSSSIFPGGPQADDCFLKKSTSPQEGAFGCINLEFFFTFLQDGTFGMH